VTASALLLALTLAAPADSGLGGYLGGLSDSTDAYFGISGARPDTTSFDSLLAVGLAQPGGILNRGPVHFGPAPWVGFNRVLGPLWGASLTASARPLGALDGRLGYAAGPNLWLGGGEYTKSWGRRPRASRGYATEATWTATVRGGRFQGVMDLDRRESVLAVARAFIWGTDRQHYLLRDGVRASLIRETPSLRLGLEARDELDSPLDVTASWNLYRREPVVPFNLPARLGRVHELGVEGTVRLGRAPAWIEAESRWADEAWGSDLQFTRLRVAAAADLPLGNIAALIPQATWGRLAGRDIPQAAFYLGGASSLRSVPGWSLGGTRKALARLDLLTSTQLFAPLHLPPQLPISLGAFGGVGAVWGDDPYGGPGSPENEWPQRNEWLVEAGASLLYRPGLPDPRGHLRFDWAWPIGPGRGPGRFTLYYSRPIDLLRITSR